MSFLFKHKATDDEIEDRLIYSEEKEEEDAFVIDNSGPEEKQLFFEGMLSQYVNPMFGPKFWQEPRKFSVYTNGLVEKEKLKGTKNRFSTVNSLSFELNSDTTLKKIVPEDADMQQFVFVVSCTVFSSRNSIFAADITAAPRVVKYMFRAFSRASYYEWLYKIKHIMDNTWMADLAVAKFGKNLGFRIRALPKLKAPSSSEAKEKQDNKNSSYASEEGEVEVEVDMVAAEHERKRQNRKRRRRRHAHMKLLLPNQTDFSIALEQRHYDSREQGGEILNLFLSHLERNILVADKVTGAREWRQRMNVVEARKRAEEAAALAKKRKRKGKGKGKGTPTLHKGPLFEDKGTEAGPEDGGEDDQSDGDENTSTEQDKGEQNEGKKQSSFWRFLPSLSMLGFGSKAAVEAAAKEKERKRKEDRQKERDGRSKLRHDEPSSAAFLVRLRRAVYKNTVVVRALTVPRGHYRHGLYYRVYAEGGRLVVEYDPQYIWMNLDSIGKDVTEEVLRDWGSVEAEGEMEQGYDATSDFDSDLLSSQDGSSGSSSSDDDGDRAEGWSSDDDVGGEAFEQDESDEEPVVGGMVVVSAEGVDLSSPSRQEKGTARGDSSTSTATLSSSSGQGSAAPSPAAPDRNASASKRGGGVERTRRRSARENAPRGGSPAVLATLTPSPRASTLPRRLQQSPRRAEGAPLSPGMDTDARGLLDPSLYSSSDGESDDFEEKGDSDSEGGVPAGFI